MFKKIVAIFLLLALTGSNLSRYLVVVSFQLNRKYIVENYCENKSRPQLHCNGKCFLAKKLKQAGDHEKKQTEKQELKNIEVCFLQQIFPAFDPPVAVETAVRLPAFYDLALISSYTSSIFKPPRQLA